MLAFKIDDLLPYIKDGNYSLAMAELTYLLSEQNTPLLSSVLFVNRGQMQEAFEDFEQSIAQNHLNYVAYFNQYSLCSLAKKKDEALKNLCCSLSCLHLLKGRKKGDLSSIEKALEYCGNNIEARLAKGLIHLKKSENELALNQINYVLQNQPENKQYRLIKNKMVEKLGGEMCGSQALPRQNKEKADLAAEKTLKCSYYMEEQLQQVDIQCQIAKKLQQFTNIYQELNESHGDLIIQYPRLHLQRYHIQIQPDSYQSNHQSPTSKPYKQQIGENLSIVQANEEEEENSQNLYYENQGQLADGKGSNFESSSSLTLMAADMHKKISIRVHQISKKGQSQGQQNIYCKFKYGRKSMKTSQQNQMQSLDEQFEAELTDDQAQIIQIQVFKKQINEYKDLYMGRGEAEVVETGKIEVKIYYYEEERREWGRVVVDIREK